ncbi:P1 protein [Cowpea polerovirus 2]|uniref:p1 protein n=2 Tax=Cowpea polerovirus 2 TaxID=1913125 RepID=A0A1U9RYB2_9VIRU|nr:P1 protein [Cowpea polerovirus 2]AQV03236.1 P1 protein [Cowpea polerovirus 2]
MNSFCAVLFFFCLFFCAAPKILGSESQAISLAWSVPSNFTLHGLQRDWGFTPPLSPVYKEQCLLGCQTWSSPGTGEKPPLSYRGIMLDLWELVSRDAKTSYSAVSDTLNSSFKLTADFLITSTEEIFRSLCWFLIFVWYSLLRMIIVSVWHFVTRNFTLALAAAWLFILSVALAKTVRWFSGLMPTFLVAIFFSIPRWCLRRLFWGKSSRNYEEEKCCEQFLSFTINQDPPKRSQLVFQTEEGKHAGYGTCVRLYNGTNGLLTAYHVASSASKVVSTRTGNKIPLSSFKPLMVSTLYDQVLYAGPVEWESILGCKGVNFAPAKSLGASDCNIFHIQENGKWGCSNATIEGQLKHHGKENGVVLKTLPGQLSVLSHTVKGQSGAGYYNGKTLVAVHVGGSLECEDEDATYNVAVPVLPKAGITAPNYVFETSAPTSGVFDCYAIDELSRAYDKAVEWMNSKREKGEVLWADMEDEIFYEAETSAPKPEPVSGNGKRGADRRTTGKSVQTPGSAVSATPVKDIPTGEQIMTMLVERIANNINLKEVERASIKAIQEHALKKPSRSSRRRKNKKQDGNNGGPKLQTTAASSTLNSSGRYQPPHKRSPASGSVAKPLNGTTQNRNNKVNGGKRSSGNIPTWVRKPKASGGPSSVRKPN